MKILEVLIILFLVSVSAQADFMMTKQENYDFQTQIRRLMSKNVDQQNATGSRSVFKSILSPGDVVMTNKTNPELFDYLASALINPLCRTNTGATICHEYSLLNRSGVELSYQPLPGFLDKIVLVETKSTALPLDSFSYFGEPWIFFNVDTITYEHMLRMMAHEIYQLVDIKNIIHIDARVRALYLVDESDCKALSVLRNDHLRLVTSAIRSFIMEDRIVGEITGGFRSYGLEKLSCEQRINKFIDQIKLLPKNFTSVGMGIEKLLIGGSQNRCLTLNAPISFEDALRFSQQIGITNNETNTRMSVCEFLVRPAMSGFSWMQDYQQKLYMQGPRPRVGDP